MSTDFSVSANVVDIIHREVRPATIQVADGKIVSIEPCEDPVSTFILPGFIDSHVHVESSMLTPAMFARTAVVHGTVATVSDPHEIANVLGIEGVRYMLDNAEQTPLKIYFGAPSCVPATTFETAGAALSVDEVIELLDDPRILYLSEMMNFPGVLNCDPEVMAKIHAAQERSKPVDGHAPGLRGEAARAYIAAGITTDHECFAKEEALDKLQNGCLISIREGSAARNFDALHSLVQEYPDSCMFCSDDKHPDELLIGHINILVRRAVASGVDAMNALQAACINPITHYQLDVGQLREGDNADFIEVDDLTQFNVLRTWIDGAMVAEQGESRVPAVTPTIVNHFDAQPRQPAEFAIPAVGDKIKVIEAIDGQLITNRLVETAKVEAGFAVADVERDILKIAVVNRYRPAAPKVAFIKNFGLSRGAIASSVAHDSHNIVAVGTNDQDLCEAVNLVIREQGGLSVADAKRVEVLPLPIAGLMATGTCEEVGAAYEKLDQLVKELGSTLRAPFMTLSFMALLVIPELKLSDLGLFDGKTFEFTPVFGDE